MRARIINNVRYHMMMLSHRRPGLPVPHGTAPRHRLQARHRPERAKATFPNRLCPSGAMLLWWKLFLASPARAALSGFPGGCPVGSALTQRLSRGGQPPDARRGTHPFRRTSRGTPPICEASWEKELWKEPYILSVRERVYMSTMPPRIPWMLSRPASPPAVSSLRP